MDNSTSFLKRHPLLRFLYDSKRYCFGVFGIIILSILAGPLKTYIALLWGTTVDTAVAGNLDAIMPIAFFIVLLVGIDSLRNITWFKIIGYTVEKIFMNIRRRMFSCLIDSDTSTLEENIRSGDTAKRVGDDIQSLSNLLSLYLPNSIRFISQAAFAIGAGIIISWQMSLFYFILLPLSVWGMYKISKPIEEKSKTSMDIMGKAINLGTEIITGIDNVKSYNLQKEMNERFEKELNESYTQMKKIEKISIRMTTIRFLFSILQIVPLLLLGVWLVSLDIITVGTVLAFVALSVYIKEMLEMFGFIFYSFRNSTALARRLYEIIDIPKEQNGHISDFDENSIDENLLEMKGLYFSYGVESEHEAVLKGINVKLKKNQKIALIGPSGCGKSTLIKLICRFYNHSEGHFKLFGVDARHIDIHALRQKLALVSQDTMLFDGNIYENVAYGKTDASEEEVLYAIKNADLWNYVSTLPDSVYSDIGEFGGQLSGGQRQRISIARAMLKGADIILLDEPTSALDTQTEKEVQLVLDALTVDKSVIIVAHRISTVQNVDYIYCLDDGKIIEEGSPEDLLDMYGYYYKMCLKQGVI